MIQLITQGDFQSKVETLKEEPSVPVTFCELFEEIC